MADYYSPTVIQPDIPVAEMTACEFLLLATIFQHEITDGSAYFYSEDGGNLLPEFDVSAVREALNRDSPMDSTTVDLFAKRLATINDEDTFDIDMSVQSFEFIFQDIVRRSKSLDYVTVTTSYLCSKMRPDGFGGLAVLITADRILGKSTDDVLMDFLDEVDPHAKFLGREQ
ncbi:hypothetical protein [Asticcacaulis taihuensis]|uniref:hypothetical protein n=1 Tax=Asticcacaulis taihuensis TaxID=260084 RepID=UPI0026F22C9A|nr:hypothetical protein [Asticcacaulis taihuensis]